MEVEYCLIPEADRHSTSITEPANLNDSPKSECVRRFCAVDGQLVFSLLISLFTLQ